MRIIDLDATGRDIKRLRLEAGLTVRNLQEKLGFPDRRNRADAAL